MAEITAALVKDLREKTGAGMMDCKRALNETAGDLEGAIDWLRKKGLAAAAKKAGRVAAEGLVAVAAAEGVGAVVEVNSETDFVARNDKFQGFAAQVAELALHVNGDVEALKATTYTGTDHDVAAELTTLVATIGENMSLRRSAHLSVEHGVVCTYMHNALVKGLGKIGVLVALESTGDKDKLTEAGRHLAMHIAAARPEALNIADMDATRVERERAILAEKAATSGKPAAIIEKMVEGGLRKFYEEVVLLEQAYVIDGSDRKVKEVVEGFAKEVGAPVVLKGFVRFALGEGIEKAETDFAAEVAAVAKA